MHQPDPFEDIRPYRDHEVPAVVERLAHHPSYLKMMRFIYPERTDEEYREELLQVNTVNDFQEKIAHPGMRKLVDSTVDEITISGLNHINPNGAYLFISNHRDIILDSAIMNILLFEKGYGTFETAIGSNLLQDELVADLTKLNKNFVVMRNTGAREFYENSLRLSEYIQDTICRRNSSVWIAQREGRTKDGLDKTQPGLLKMLSIQCQEALRDCFRKLNVTPVAISYEYDPCDVLKIPELKAVNRDEKYVKKPGEDFQSILTGLTGYKGRVHLSIGKPLRSELEILKDFPNQNDKLKILGEIIDKHIYREYKLWPTNYIALDLLMGSSEYNEYYTPEQYSEFSQRIETRLKNEGLLTKEDKNLLLAMYANPVRNFEVVSKKFKV